MEEKEFLSDILEMEKNMVVNYAISLNEASCDNLYKEYFRQFNELSKATKDLFNIAYNKSWYVLEEATNSKINQECKTLKDEITPKKLD